MISVVGLALAILTSAYSSADDTAAPVTTAAAATTTTAPAANSSIAEDVDIGGGRSIYVECPCTRSPRGSVLPAITPPLPVRPPMVSEGRDLGAPNCLIAPRSF